MGNATAKRAQTLTAGVLEVYDGHPRTRMHAKDQPAELPARGRLPASPPLRAARLESRPQSHTVSASMEMRIRVLDEHDRHTLSYSTPKTKREGSRSTRARRHTRTHAWTQNGWRGKHSARSGAMQRPRPKSLPTTVSLARSRTRCACDLPIRARRQHMNHGLRRGVAHRWASRRAGCWLDGVPSFTMYVGGL